MGRGGSVIRAGTSLHFTVHTIRKEGVWDESTGKEMGHIRTEADAALTLVTLADLRL